MIRKLLNLSLVITIIAASFGFGATNAMAQTNYIHYRVQPGDTLGKIAYRYCTDWKTIRVNGEAERGGGGASGVGEPGGRADRGIWAGGG